MTREQTDIRHEAAKLAYQLECHRFGPDLRERAVAVVDAMRARLSHQDAEIARLRATLAFYATIDNWHTPSTGFAAQYDPDPAPIWRDGGHRARAALSPIPEDGKP